jgi:hypothetical protein
MERIHFILQRLSLYCDLKYISVVFYLKSIYFILIKWKQIHNTFLARGDACGSGNVLQGGRSRVRFAMVSLEFLLT